VSMCKYIAVGMLAVILKYISVERVVVNDELNYAIKYALLLRQLFCSLRPLQD
jgi:hypothetical protein